MKTRYFAIRKHYYYYHKQMKDLMIFADQLYNNFEPKLS